MGSGFASRSDGVPDLMPALTEPGPAGTLVPTSMQPHQYSALSTPYSPHHPPLPHFAFSKGFSAGTITGAMTDFQTA